MELFEALTTRTSAATLAAPGPSPEDLARMLEAAAHAPDHGRLKPWRLIVLDEPMRLRFAEAAVAARRARLPPPTEDQLRVERDKIWRSPTVVVVGCAVDRSNTKIPEVEQVLAAGAAAQNLMLAARMASRYGARCGRRVCLPMMPASRRPLACRLTITSWPSCI